MYITFNLQPEKTKELEDYIKQVLPEIINENIFADTNKLKQLINECVKGQIKATINDLMQGKEFRNYLRDEVMIQIGMKERTIPLEQFKQEIKGNIYDNPELLKEEQNG